MFVFTFFLKTSSVLQFLMLTGRLFNRVGAAILKHLLPYIRLLVYGTVSSSSDSGLMDLVRC